VPVEVVAVPAVALLERVVGLEVRVVAVECVGDPARGGLPDDDRGGAAPLRLEMKMTNVFK
jgi:hypothetical protein